MNIIIWFLVLYPMSMSLFWMVGSVFHQCSKKKRTGNIGADVANIGIFVPCYNEEETIKIVMEKILKNGQLLTEIILIDNGSTDSTLSILTMLAKLDSRIHVLKTEGNTGKANALNTALEYTSSDFIVCIDADALIEKKLLKIS